MNTKEIDILDIKHIAIIGNMGKDREEVVKKLKDFYEDGVEFRVTDKTQLVVYGNDCGKEIAQAYMRKIPTIRYKKFMHDFIAETFGLGLSNVVSAMTHYEKKKLKEQLQEKFKENNYTEKEIDELVEKTLRKQCEKALKVPIQKCKYVEYTDEMIEATINATPLSLKNPIYP